MQVHGYDTVEDVEGRLAEMKEPASSSRKDLKNIEGRLRQEHSPELALYEAAGKFLKEKSGDGKLPNLQTLKAEKEKLLVQKKKHRRKNSILANIHATLGMEHSRPAHEHEREERS